MSYRAVCSRRHAESRGRFQRFARRCLSGIWMSGDGVRGLQWRFVLCHWKRHIRWLQYGDFGDSIVKVSPPTNGAFNVLDWFTPWNQQSLSESDEDLGSGGLLLLPDLLQVLPSTIACAARQRRNDFLVDRNDMASSAPVASTLIRRSCRRSPELRKAFGLTVLLNGNLYWGSGNDNGNPDFLRAFSFNANGSGMLSTSPTSQTSQSFTLGTAAPIVLRTEHQCIVWLIDNSNGNQTLYAYDATNLANMFYNSNQAANGRDALRAQSNLLRRLWRTVSLLGQSGFVSAFGSLSQGP